MRPTLMEVLDRAYNTGPICSEDEWDKKVILKTVREVRKDRLPDLKFDPNVVIPSDNSLADELFEAGVELACKLGVLNTFTRRIVKFTEDEMRAVIREINPDFYLGAGPDIVHVVHREVEDNRPPLTYMGCFSVPVTEDIYVAVVESMVRNRNLDVLLGPGLVTAHNRELKAGTAFEVVGAKVEFDMCMEGLNRAGRPGMPMQGSVNDSTGLAMLSTAYRWGIDQGVCSMASELKMDNYGWNKVAYLESRGWAFKLYEHPMIGGYGGGVEEIALLGVATLLLQEAISSSDVIEVTPTNVWTQTNTDRPSLWAHSLVIQSTMRNTRQVFCGEATGITDCFTPEIFYENAPSLIMNSICGAAYVNGTRTAGGRYVNHTTPVENAFSEEMVKYVAGKFKREEANELVLKIFPKFEDKLKSPPKGKSFEEIMDMQTLRPKKEWQEMYDRVRKEFVDMGVLPL